MKLTPSRRVYALGVILLVAFTITCRNFADRGGPAFMAALAVASAAYLLAFREFIVTSQFPRHVVIFGLLITAACHLQFLSVSPGIDDDIHRYVWDGRLQRLHYNPYLVVPSDAAYAHLHTPETRSLNNPDLPSPYPPGAQLFFRLVTGIHESALALKIAFVLCAWLIAFLLLDLLRQRNREAHLVLIYAWNPLLAIEVAGSGHIDIVGTLFLVASVAALTRKWRTSAAIALGLAISVKFLPLVLVPLYWRRVRVRDIALAAFLVALLYLPFLDHGRIPTGSLAAYIQGFRFNGPIFAALDHLATPSLLAAFAVCVGFLVAWLLRRTEQHALPEHFAWPLAASLLCAPVIFPWYLLWLLPFLTSASTLLILVWTVSIIPTYLQWHLRRTTGTWGALPIWVMLLEYGCLAVVAALVLLARLRNSTHSAPVHQAE